MFLSHTDVSPPLFLGREGGRKEGKSLDFSPGTTRWSKQIVLAVYHFPEHSKLLE